MKVTTNIDIGSCSLQIVHDAFRAGAEQSELELKKFLKRAFTVFHNSSAHREDCESVIGSSSCPLSFCATRKACLHLDWQMIQQKMIEIRTQMTAASGQDNDNYWFCRVNSLQTYVWQMCAVDFLLLTWWEQKNILPFIYLTCNSSKCFYLSNRWVENK